MAGFSARDVLYLIMTDRFADGDLRNDGPEADSAAGSPAAAAERAKPRGWHGGDLQGVLQHLDYLQQLGVTGVWITPVYTNAEPQAYHGYHATDYYGVDPHLGSMADLQQLAKALHARGMKLVLDTVPNHVGPGHPWVTDEPAPTWFHGTAGDHLKAESNFAALIDPHAPERDKRSTLHGWFANALPDMIAKNIPPTGLTFVYDPSETMPTTVNNNTNYNRFDQYGRPLPFTPNLPVSPDLLYSGQPTGNSLVQ